jgi:anti-anti-sigma factor
VNVGGVVRARSDAELRQILFEADLVLGPDPLLVQAARWLGNPLPTAGHPLEFVALLLQTAARLDWPVVLLGEGPAAVARAAAGANSAFPGLALEGVASPAHTSLIELPHHTLGREIRERRPRVLLVDLKHPLGEKWIGMNHRTLQVPLCVAAEGVTAWLAGFAPSAGAGRAVPRAAVGRGPMGADATRFLRRWGHDVWVFGAALAWNWWHLTCRRCRRSRGTRPTLDHLPEQSVQVLRLPRQLNAATVHEGEALWQRLQGRKGHLVLDLSRVACLDSTGVGLIIRLQKFTRAAGGQLALLAPSPTACWILRMLRCAELIPTAPDLASACRLVASREAEELVVVTLGIPDPHEPLAWQGEVTAANAPEVWHLTQVHLDHSRGRNAGVAINLADLRFIDSAGAALMVRTRRYATRHGLQLRFSSPQPRVVEVLRTLQLEEYLLERR